MSAVHAPAPWLVAHRDAARSRYGDSSPPTGDEEVWRYSRIASIDLDAFAAPSMPTSDIGPIGAADAAMRLIVRDGFVTGVEGTAPGSSVVGRLVDHPDAESIYAAVAGPATDAPGELHDASVQDPLVIDIGERVHVDGPIVIDGYSDIDGGLTSPHTIVRAGAGAAVTVVERRRSGPAHQLVLPTVEIDAGPAARIGYVVVQDLGAATVALERHASTGAQQSHTVVAVAAFGGWYARVRSDFSLDGRGASGDLLAVFFGDGDQMLDFRTFQEHRAPDTTSNLLFKGAVTGAAQSVYSGLIRVAETAPGTNAFQTNRNLKLSDEAWAYSVPNLEIEQNQVSCSHASTVGEIDDEQRFYLESRGVPPTVAEQLLVSGFFAEVIDQFPAPGVRGEIRSTIDDALAADRARVAS